MVAASPVTGIGNNTSKSVGPRRAALGRVPDADLGRPAHSTCTAVSTTVLTRHARTHACVSRGGSAHGIEAQIFFLMGMSAAMAGAAASHSAARPAAAIWATLFCSCAKATTCQHQGTAVRPNDAGFAASCSSPSEMQTCHLALGNASIPALLRNSLLCSQIHITTQLGHRIAWALLGSHGMVAWAMHPKGMPPTWGLAAAQTTRDRMARPVRWTGTLAGRSEAQVAVMLAILLIGSVLGGLVGVGEQQIRASSA